MFTLVALFVLTVAFMVRNVRGGILIAVVLNEFRHAQGYLRVLVYLPVMLPPAV